MRVDRGAPVRGVPGPGRYGQGWATASLSKVRRGRLKRTQSIECVQPMRMRVGVSTIGRLRSYLGIALAA